MLLQSAAKLVLRNHGSAKLQGYSWTTAGQAAKAA
jgi:hypothetical protein